jgi:hypothetical protein
MREGVFFEVRLVASPSGRRRWASSLLWRSSPRRVGVAMFDSQSPAGSAFVVGFATAHAATIAVALSLARVQGGVLAKREALDLARTSARFAPARSVASIPARSCSFASAPVAARASGYRCSAVAWRPVACLALRGIFAPPVAAGAPKASPLTAE